MKRVTSIGAAKPILAGDSHRWRSSTSVGAVFDASNDRPRRVEAVRGRIKAARRRAARLDRLFGLTWGAEDLSAAIGASTNLDETGAWALTYRIVRTLMLLGAKAAGVQAIDTLYVDFRDDTGLRAASRRSRAEGFTGRLAIHPAQVAAINESYLRSAAEIDQAHRIVAAFDAAPGTGTVGLDGKMIDLPHLKQAQALLAQYAPGESSKVR